MQGVASGFIRRYSVVEAVLVTRENFDDVVKWCGGIKGVTDGSGPVEWFVRVPVVKTNSYDNKPKRAFIGDYVMLDQQGFKVYRGNSFDLMYKELDSDSVMDLIADINKILEP